MHILRSMLLIAAATVLAACAVFSSPDAPRYVRLHLTGAEASIVAAPGTGGTLLVAPPRAQPGYDTTHFAYIEGGHELRYYGRHEWIAEPSSMLQPAVIRALESSGAFAAVLSPPSTAVASHRLDLELVALYQDYRASGGSSVVLTVRAQLVSAETRAVLGTRTFEYREAAGTGPVSGAAAADRALSRLLEDLVAFCIDAG